jgi:Ca2+-binding EF-hand superfamily protein
LSHFQSIFLFLGEKLTSAQFDQLTEGMEGPNGAINIEEFIQKMMSDKDEIEPAE